jgi:hypothetical protein
MGELKTLNMWILMTAQPDHDEGTETDEMKDK